MRVLYVASAIRAGDASGGATHVSEVACGLRDLGHEVRVICRAPSSRTSASALCPGVQPRFTHLPQQLGLLGLPTVAGAARTFKPDVVMERYYNFAGAGVLWAHRHHVPSVLEINAPMVDPPGSLKTRLDALALGSMRRWAVRQARWSAVIVTPLSGTVPFAISRRKIHELPWGANVEQFEPNIRTRDAARRGELAGDLGLAAGHPVAVFLGSFRSWHGVGHFAEAARRLLAGGSDLSFLAIGGGPELEPLKQKVSSWGLPPGRFVLAGPQPHDRVPALLGLADIGVAPFDLASYPPLTTFGFYWSPLKVFEYMAMALPVVTVDVTPLNEIVRHGREGLLYRSGDIPSLVRALSHLTSDPSLRHHLGASARLRVCERYSWRSHCLSLEAILKRITSAHNG
ncbi:MAG: glycosyltransferase family 4 protein [Chloroflexia bacterium]